jgi:hypothetical protein
MAFLGKKTTGFFGIIFNKNIVLEIIESFNILKKNCK